jgi:hypothetical protein
MARGVLSLDISICEDDQNHQKGYRYDPSHPLRKACGQVVIEQCFRHAQTHNCEDYLGTKGGASLRTTRLVALEARIVGGDALRRSD